MGSALKKERLLDDKEVGVDVSRMRCERALSHPQLMSRHFWLDLATLGGFIGAGGYGGPILHGIDKFDVPLMLEGAFRQRCWPQ